MDIVFRPAVEDDFEILNNLVRASKGHWGYSKKFMDGFMEYFHLTPQHLINSTLHVMLTENEIVGVTGFKKNSQDLLELEYFFIHSSQLGKGYGRALWKYTCQLAEKFTESEFILWSDPHAEVFYHKMGCEKIGERESPLLPNRNPPILRYELSLSKTEK